MALTIFFIAACGAFFLCGFTLGERHGIEDTEERWSDAVRRNCTCTERLP